MEHGMTLAEALKWADTFGPLQSDPPDGDAPALMVLAAEVRRLRDDRDLEKKWRKDSDELASNALEALKEISDLAGWHTDDEADPDDTSPDDAVAHTNGLIRKRCRVALMGPNAELRGGPAVSSPERPA